MFPGGILLSITVLGFAAWLHWNETQGWPNEPDVTERDQSYLAKRRKSRSRVHLIMAFCGVLILAATIAGPGPLFVGAWTCVAFCLMTVVMLALLDAFRTHRYYINKIPENRRRLLDGDE